MIARLKELLSLGRNGAEAADLRLATAALLVEAARMDGVVDPAEQARILALLRDRFGISEAEAGALAEDAGRAADETVQLFGFTRIINDSLMPEDRVRMIEMLWEVAYADGRLHDYEANLIRRISGLLFVSDQDSGEARKRVLARRHPTENPA
ncbi:MAG: TerB family tellurite resistance protein [Magnetospirillum sp.]|nr:TerB family tellurite resistance protein [Magnetospirillum sp.]